MKKVLLPILTFCLLISAHAGEFEKKVDHFTTVTATGNYKVNLIKSDEEKVVVINNDSEVTDEKILIDVKGAELKIRIKNDLFKERKLEITVYYKKVTAINSKKGCVLVVQEVMEEDVIHFKSGNGGKIRAKVKCETVIASIGSGGSINISGEANIAEYKVATGGTIDAVNNNVKTVTAKISAGGDIRCAATEKMTNTVSTGGNIHYRFSGADSDYSEKVTLGGEIKKIKDK